MSSQNIKTVNTQEFLEAHMHPDPRMMQIIKSDYDRFFIVDIQELIQISRLPVPPTRAKSHTLIYLTSGIATLKVGANRVELQQNECLVVPAGQVFSYDKYEVNTGFLCNVSHDFLVGKMGSNELLAGFEFLTVWGNPIIRPNAQTATYLTHGFQRIFDAYLADGLAQTQLIQAYFLSLLCELQTAYQPLSTHANKTAVTLSNRFKELLHKHISTTHSVAEYASLLNVSPNHLNKTIKLITHKTTSQWIGETLVTESKVLLAQTNNSVGEIAASLGVHDSSYFSRLFKKHEGMTPLAYRKMIE